MQLIFIVLISLIGLIILGLIVKFFIQISFRLKNKTTETIEPMLSSLDKSFDEWNNREDFENKKKL